MKAREFDKKFDEGRNISRHLEMRNKLTYGGSSRSCCGNFNRIDVPLIQAHPWHGISAGENAPEVVNSYIEVVPLDTVKFEVDKVSGHLKVDRPHKYSSLCPALYGFIPRTYCNDNVASLVNSKSAKNLKGDKDPLDICVLTEHTITRNGILVSARPVGGFRLIDSGEVDDKIIAILVDDPAYGQYKDISQIPVALIERLKHYFLTYKEGPQSAKIRKKRVVISDVYPAREALKVIRASLKDYNMSFRGEQS